MSGKLIKALVVICLVLMSIITLEWLIAKHSQQQLLNSIESPTQQTSTDEMPVIKLDTQSEESYADLVDRPLFIAGRKPVSETESEQQAAIVTNNFDWRLSGVYTSKKGLMALLSRIIARTPDPTGKTPTDNYRKVIVGGDVDGWKVAAIHADDILLTQGDTEKKLPLRLPRAKEIQGQNGVMPLNPPQIPQTPSEVVDPALQVAPELPVEPAPQTEPAFQAEPENLN